MSATWRALQVGGTGCEIGIRRSQACVLAPNTSGPNWRRVPRKCIAGGKLPAELLLLPLPDTVPVTVGKRLRGKVRSARASRKFAPRGSKAGVLLERLHNQIGQNRIPKPRPPLR